MSTTPLQPAHTDAWISPLRFKPFLAATAGDHARAVTLYEWNAQLAGALLETFAHTEVLVRNAIHAQLRAGRPANALRSWLLDPDVLGEVELKRVEEVVARLKGAKKQPTEDRVLAGLSMGFWTGILGRRYEELWRQSLRHAFPHGDGTRNQAAGCLNRVVTLRNRVAHHEALISEPVTDRHNDALALAAAIDPYAKTWIDGISRVPALVAARP